MKRHSGVISEFRRRYIKTGIFDMEMSTIISDLFNIRTDSDYDDFFVIAKEDVAVQIQNAETFLAQAKALLAAKGTFQYFPPTKPQLPRPTSFPWVGGAVFTLFSSASLAAQCDYRILARGNPRRHQPGDEREEHTQRNQNPRAGQRQRSV